MRASVCAIFILSDDDRTFFAQLSGIGFRV